MRIHEISGTPSARGWKEKSAKKHTECGTYMLDQNNFDQLSANNVNDLSKAEIDLLDLQVSPGSFIQFYKNGVK